MYYAAGQLSKLGDKGAKDEAPLSTNHLSCILDVIPGQVYTASGRKLDRQQFMFWCSHYGTTRNQYMFLPKSHPIPVPTVELLCYIPWTSTCSESDESE